MVARANAYVSQKTLLKQNKSLAMSLNDYRDATIFANYKLCVGCKKHCSEYGARQLKPNDDLYESYELEHESLFALVVRMVTLMRRKGHKLM